MSGLMITTRELLEKTALRRNQLKYLMRKFSDQVKPARQEHAKMNLWHYEMIDVVLSLRTAVQKHKPRRKLTAEEILKRAI